MRQNFLRFSLLRPGGHWKVTTVPNLKDVFREIVGVGLETTKPRSPIKRRVFRITEMSILQNHMENVYLIKRHFRKIVGVTLGRDQQTEKRYKT